MNRTRQFLALLAVSIGAAAALLVAPIAAADPDGGGGPNNPLLPSCESEGGNIISGGATDCAEAGNSQITASPGMLGEGYGDYGGYGGYGFGMGFGW
ncbi:MAG: hypothetical protein FGM25_14190 [Mycobacterium sp.]|nr:hypothetical protein [Mycobacterium sp.]